jgi:hypothetical protein
MQQPIRVRAKPGVLVPVPRLHGGVAQYVGRDIDAEAFQRKETDNEKLYPISKEPTEFSVLQHGVEVMAEIRRILRDGDLLLELKVPSRAPEPPAPMHAVPPPPPVPKTLAQEPPTKGKA